MLNKVEKEILNQVQKDLGEAKGTADKLKVEVERMSIEIETQARNLIVPPKKDTEILAS